MQRNIVIVQALDDISRQSVGERANLQHRLHLAALQRHAPRHDQPDVAGAEDHDFPAGNIALHIDHALRCTRRVNACRPSARNPYRAARALAATHRQDDRLSAKLHNAPFRVDSQYGLILAHFQDHRIDEDFHLGQILDKIIAPLGIAGPGQFLLEMMKAEAVVDALLQDAAGLTVALQHENLFRAVLLRGQCRRKPSRTTADNDDVVKLAHFRPPPSFSSYI